VLTSVSHHPCHAGSDVFEKISLPGAPLRNRTVDLLLTIHASFVRWRRVGSDRRRSKGLRCLTASGSVGRCLVPLSLGLSLVFRIFSNWCTGESWWLSWRKYRLAAVCTGCLRMRLTLRDGQAVSCSGSVPCWRRRPRSCSISSLSWRTFSARDGRPGCAAAHSRWRDSFSVRSSLSLSRSEAACS